MTKHKHEEEHDDQAEAAPAIMQIVLDREMALGYGTRKKGFVLGEINDGDPWDDEHIRPAQGVAFVEIQTVIRNQDIVRVQ